MPTYEYVCKSCGRHLEVTQSFHDDPLTNCPSCDGELRKVFGSIGIAFKGSGFYKTDSRSGAKSSSGSSESTKTPADSESSSTKPKPSEKPAEAPAASPKPDNASSNKSAAS